MNALKLHDAFKHYCESIHRKRHGAKWCAAGASLAALLTVLLAVTDLRAQATPGAAAATPIIPKRLFQFGTGIARDSVTFGSVMWVAPRVDGGCYLYDGRTQRVLRFDATGAVMVTIGQVGKGNGAFGEVTGGAAYRDSLIALWDPTAARVALFHESGTFRRNIPYAKDARGIVSRSTMLQFATDTTGLLYLRIQNAMGSDRYSWLRIRDNGSVVDSIATRSPRNEARYTSDGYRTSFLSETLRAPFAGGGVLIGDPANYQIAITNGRDTTTVIKHAWTPVTIAPGERAEWLSYLNRGRPLKSGSTDSLLPKTKPAFRALLSDRTGNIWVELHGPARADSTASDALSFYLPSYWRDATRYDVFDPRGAFLYQVELPRHTYMLAVDGRRLWLNETVNGKSVIGVYTF